MSASKTFNKILSQREKLTQATRRRKYVFYAAGAVLLLVAILYFMRQFNLLMQERQTSLTPPVRSEKLDTTKNSQPALTRLYEQEEKNRYRDSVDLLRQDNALNYIVMDWENLYDVRKKQVAKSTDSTNVALDSLNMLLQLLKEKNTTQLTNASAKPVRKKRAKRSKIGKQANRIEKQLANATETVDPFNTVHATGYASAIGKENDTRDAAASSVIAAVVHGSQKVSPGDKVTFRTLEEATFNGRQLPKNTLITAMAAFSKGRISFTSFRAKTAGAVQPLALTCYDSDMIAGISYQDQSLIESEVRKGSASALSDATSDLSAAIPYGTLARAGSTIARGIIRGSARNRKQFILLPDGYSVFLQVAPDKLESAVP